MALGCNDCYEAERNHGCCPYGGYCDEQASHMPARDEPELEYYDVSAEERESRYSGCEHWDYESESCRDVPCY